MKKPLSRKVTKDMQALSGNLFMLRTRANLTPKALAEAVGVTKASIWNIENGFNLPSLSVYKKLCAILKQPAPPML